MLLGLDEVRRAYETGRGVVRMRAKVEIGPLEGSRGRQAITVTELPYGVGAEKIIEKITDEVNKSKRLTGHRRRQGPHRPRERHPRWSSSARSGSTRRRCSPTCTG